MTKLKLHFQWLPQAAHHEKTPATLAGIPAPKQRAWHTEKGFLEFKSPMGVTDEILAQIYKKHGALPQKYPFLWITPKRVFLATTPAAHQMILKNAPLEKKHEEDLRKHNDYYPFAASYALNIVSTAIDVEVETLQKNLIK